MFGVDTSELLVVAVVALLFIGPKELPQVMMRVGRWIGQDWLVEKGLSAGERVIVDGVVKARPGSPVRIADPNAAPAAAPGAAPAPTGH